MAVQVVPRPPKEIAAKATRDGYGLGLVEAGRRHPEVVALDADLAESTRSQWFAKEFPERFFQMGVAEGDMMVTAAGLASCGKVPFASSFAIFAERAFEQVRNSIARTGANVKIVGSHGGLQVGEDGNSAQCIEDVALYRSLPGFVVTVPADWVQAQSAVEAFVRHKGPCYMRLTRSKVPVYHPEDHVFEIGKAYLLREGEDATIAACGAMVEQAMLAAEILAKRGVAAAVLNVPSVKPLDVEAIVEAAQRTGALVTAEDHNVIGGLGSAVAECLAERQPTPLVRIGVQDVFAESGSSAELYRKYGLSAEHVAAAVEKAVARKA